MAKKKKASKPTAQAVTPSDALPSPEEEPAQTGALHRCCLRSSTRICFVQERPDGLLPNACNLLKFSCVTRHSSTQPVLCRTCYKWRP